MWFRFAEGWPKLVISVSCVVGGVALPCGVQGCLGWKVMCVWGVGGGESLLCRTKCCP